MHRPPQAPSAATAARTASLAIIGSDADAVKGGTIPRHWAIEGAFMVDSPFLNLYLYPDEVDYPRATPLGPTWHNLHSSVRTTDPEWSVPTEIADGIPGARLEVLQALARGDIDVAEAERRLATPGLACRPRRKSR